MASLPTMHRLAATVLAAAAALCTGGCATAPDTATWTDLFDGRSLEGFVPSEFGGDGEITVADGAIHFDFGSPLTGLTWQGTLPSGEYEIECIARRIDGSDFFCGLTFPVNDGFLTLVLGGWGGAVCGLSNLDGMDAWNNQTCTMHRFENDIDYVARVQIRSKRVDVTLDGEPLFSADIEDRELDLRPEVWRSRPLGVCAFSTRAEIRALRWRPLPPAAPSDT